MKRAASVTGVLADALVIGCTSIEGGLFGSSTPKMTVVLLLVRMKFSSFS